MSDYLHGAYGETNIVASPVTEESQSAFVIVGTAPVGQVAGGANNVNKPIVVRNIAEARKYFGYSSEWDKYTLCEAFHVFFELKGYGPLVVINVLDPAKTAHKAGTASTASLTPANGGAQILNAEDAILDSLVLSRGSDDNAVTFVKGTDYNVEYNFARKSIDITILSGGAIGTTEFTATYNKVNAAGVTDADVIGTTDGLGLNTGLQAIRNIYNLTNMVPAFLIAPGFSSSPDVHTAMEEISLKVNNHWDMFMYADLPLTDGSTALTLDTVATYKNGNGFNQDNEKVFWPMVTGTDGKKYHLSTLAAAELLEVTTENGDIPYNSSSNRACTIIENLFFGTENDSRVIDDYIINEKLNKNGISSAAFVGGRWAIWGAHCASWNNNDGTAYTVAETNPLMLFYLNNDFQIRHTEEVDLPLSRNDLDSMVAEEQARLDALVQIGALTYGQVSLEASADLRSDMINGDWKISRRVSTMPLAKSFTVITSWVEDGYMSYYDTEEAE